MPQSYHHLTHDDRCQIYALKSTDTKQSDIAKLIGVHPSTISRELKRNQGGNGYRYLQAQRLADQRRHQASTTKHVMTPTRIEQVESLLRQRWSPEQIAGRLKRGGILVSYESIYQHVREDKARGGHLYTYLRHRGKKYSKRSSKHAGRGCIPNRVDIDKRPQVVERKSRFGDWEGDTVIGAKQKGVLVTYVERKSKYTLIHAVKNKTAEVVTQATISGFSAIPRMVKTITYDNGKEFAQHRHIANQLETTCYFAKPYHSWERGLNEHTNGLIRQYLPKGQALDEVTQQDIITIQEALNNRPRKVLGYLTPREVFFKVLNQEEKIALHG